jgi:hypothetical protein
MSHVLALGTLLGCLSVHLARVDLPGMAADLQQHVDRISAGDKGNVSSVTGAFLSEEALCLPLR